MVICSYYIFPLFYTLKPPVVDINIKCNIKITYHCRIEFVNYTVLNTDIITFTVVLLNENTSIKVLFR